ncbi:MAG TPA: hypothetical protein VGC28_01040 [Sphingomonas sp.]
MSRVSFALFAGAAFMIGAAALNPAAIAQSDTHQPGNDGSAAASMTVPPGQVAPGVDPGTASANGGVNDAIATTQMANAANQSQYAADRYAYDQAMTAHGRQVARQDAHYEHQQQAYADAMKVWRANKYACEKKGHISACNAPTPDPANYY